MYAIVEIAGKQYKVRENDKLIVPRLSGEVDDTVTFDRVLLVANDDDVQVGTPVVDNASVTATIVEHVKGDKILVFRKKRRKRFKVKRGHRQPYTRIEVSGLSVNGDAAKPKKKTASTEKAKTGDESERVPKAEAAGKAETAAKADEAAGKTAKAQAESVVAEATETPKAKKPEATAKEPKAKSSESAETPKTKKTSEAAKAEETDSTEDEAAS